MPSPKTNILKRNIGLTYSLGLPHTKRGQVDGDMPV